MPYLKRALAASSALLLGMPTATFAHTNSIGYVGNGGGSITFWYGTYHSTSFNEAELKLEGANGTSYTTQIVQFDQLTTTTPTGLDPTVNYFTTDGTQLVPYSDATAAGGQSNTWQGVTFTGLAAGDYTFTYIPLGDTESYQPNGSPTQDWAPMDQIIRSSTVTISAAVLAGSSPTLTSTATSLYSTSVVTTITDTPSVKDGVQTLDRNVKKDTTKTYQTVDTYSDGSTTISYSSSTTTTNTAEKYTGRIDQVEVLDRINSGLQSILNHTPSKTKETVRVFSKNYFGWAHGDNNYYGKSRVIGGGLEIDVKPNWTLGGQYNDVNIDLTGADSYSNLSAKHYGVFSMLRGNTLSLRTNAGLSQNTYTVARNTGSLFNNASTTNGQEWWVNNRVYVKANKYVSPFVGYTIGKYHRDAYSESGTIQTARRVEEVNKTNHTGEAGLAISRRFGGKKGDKFGFGLEASVDTNIDVTTIASLDYNQVLYIEGLHQISDGISNTAVAGKVKFRF